MSKAIFLAIALLFVFVVAPVDNVAVAAKLENVGPTGDKSHSGDLNARRYARMLNRWKTDGSNTEVDDISARYKAAPQTPLLAVEEPVAAPATVQQQVAPSYTAQPFVSAAPRMGVQRAPLSLQPLAEITNSQMQ